MPFFFEDKLLTNWFRKSKRSFPWRDNPTPYRVWVSEVMLQQTRAEVVRDYYCRWMERFPTVEILAKASEDAVVKQWEGLGYYSRARNLLEGAKYVMENFGGAIPDTASELSKIKGLGPYTVGAILSFAFHKQSAAVDGNVLRVLSRYFMLEEDISKSKAQRKFRQVAQEILPKEDSWVFNEALIELGATCCTPQPNCLSCPVSKFCKAHLQGEEYRFPVKEKKMIYERLHRFVSLIHHEEKLLIRKVPSGEVMEGLYEFPYFEICGSRNDPFELPQKVFERFQLSTSFVKILPKVHHSFTRFRVSLTPVFLQGGGEVEKPSYFWMDVNRLNELAFSSGHKKILNHFLLTKSI